MRTTQHLWLRPVTLLDASFDYDDDDYVDQVRRGSVFAAGDILPSRQIQGHAYQSYVDGGGKEYLRKLQQQHDDYRKASFDRSSAAKQQRDWENERRRIREAEDVEIDAEWQRQELANPTREPTLFLPIKSGEVVSLRKYRRCVVLFTMAPPGDGCAIRFEQASSLTADPGAVKPLSTISAAHIKIVPDFLHGDHWQKLTQSPSDVWQIGESRMAVMAAIEVLATDLDGANDYYCLRVSLSRPHAGTLLCVLTNEQGEGEYS